MHVIINSDKNVDISEQYSEELTERVQTSLARFESSLTRVEVHLGDESAGRSTGDDIRCVLEARPEGLKPESVTNNASTVDAALKGSLDKMMAVLGTTLGRRSDHKGNSSMGGVEPR